MRILFVINPNSGRSRNESLISLIQETAAMKKISVSILYTTGSRDDVTIREEIDLYKPDRVVAGGGDGTIQLVARNLIGTNIPIVLLPLGSALLIEFCHLHRRQQLRRVYKSQLLSRAFPPLRNRWYSKYQPLFFSTTLLS